MAGVNRYIFTGSRRGVIRATLDDGYRPVDPYNDGGGPTIPKTQKNIRFDILVDINDFDHDKHRFFLGICYVDGVYYVTASHALLMFDNQWKLIRSVKHDAFNWNHSVTEKDGLLFVASCLAQKIIILDLSLNVVDVQDVSIYASDLSYGRKFSRNKWHLNHIEPLGGTEALLSLAGVAGVARVDLAKKERQWFIRIPSMTHHPRICDDGHVIVSGKKHLFRFECRENAKIVPLTPRLFGWLRGIYLTEDGLLSFDVYHHCIRRFCFRDDKWTWRPVFNIDLFYRGLHGYDIMPEPDASRDECELTERMIAMGYL